MIIMERDIAVAENAALTLEVEKLQEEMSEMKLSNGFGNDAYIVYTHRPVYRTSIDHGLLHFNCDTDTWRSLPLPPASDFSFGQCFGRLLAVGGHVISDIYEFVEDDDDDDEDEVYISTVGEVYLHIYLPCLQ